MVTGGLLRHTRTTVVSNYYAAFKWGRELSSNHQLESIQKWMWTQKHESWRANSTSSSWAENENGGCQLCQR